MGHSKRSSFFKGILLLLTLAIIGLGLWFYQLDVEIRERLEKRIYTPPVEFYSAPELVYPWQKQSVAEVETKLQTRGYQKRAIHLLLRAKDYQYFTGPGCFDRFEMAFENPPNHCLLFKNEEEKVQLIAFDLEGQKVVGTFNGENEFIDSVALDPALFAQYHGNQPILRRLTSLSEMPAVCLNSVLALEDPKFLEHKGISLRGIARAFYRNIVAGRVAEGGSTLTQQMIKNFFLSSEKTVSRKLKEMAMALIFETRIDKDQILETYLNIIYMGQNGPFVVKGFGAAAHHYFHKDLEELNIAECSLLAAVLNSPGLFNPFRNPERALKRRNKAIDKMLEHGFISAREALEAQKVPLPKKRPTARLEPAPFFVQAVREKIKELGIDSEEGLKIYTTMNPEAQKAAVKAVREGLQNLEEWHKKKLDLDKTLQGLIVSANPRTGFVEALVGGRNYRKSSYNRAIKSHRQVGSVMKPFVYLAALESLDENGQAYTPLTILSDEKFTHRYEGQKWQPKNYKNKVYGNVPMFFALKNSLNLATAKLGLSIGLSSIVDIARRLGIHSKIDPLPAMTLGAYELYPLEVLEAYTTLARMGSHLPLTILRKVETLDGKVLFEYEPLPEQVVASETTAALVGMMKQTVENGTGQSLRRLGFKLPAAGKTGTTSDTRDAWFAGFTPYLVTVAWVGYDENFIHGLTGASGAIPLWANFMKGYGSNFPMADFQWPEATEKVSLSEEEQKDLGVPQPKGAIELLFRSANAP